MLCVYVWINILNVYFFFNNVMKKLIVCLFKLVNLFNELYFLIELFEIFLDIYRNSV